MDEDSTKREWDWWGIALRLFLFLFPFFIASMFVLSLYILLTPGAFNVVGGGVFAYFFPPFGKETIIPITVNGLTKNHGFSPFWAITTAALSIALVDIIVGLFLMWNFDLALKIPLIGPLIKKMETKGNKYLERKPWVRKTAFAGVMLFVIVPFQGSGGVGGTIMGRLIGVKRERVLYAITAGTIPGCFMMAAIAYYLGEAFLHIFGSYAFQAVGIMILVLVIAWAVYRFGIKDSNSGFHRGIDRLRSSKK